MFQRTFGEFDRTKVVCYGLGDSITIHRTLQKHSKIKVSKKMHAVTISMRALTEEGTALIHQAS